jgi:hypothetical protein
MGKLSRSVSLAGMKALKEPEVDACAPPEHAGGSGMFPATISQELVLPLATRIHLRHGRHNLWCGSGGAWFRDRNHAVTFRSNLDALLYCQALHLAGFIVGFSEQGRQVYQLDATRVVEEFRHDSAGDVTSDFELSLVDTVLSPLSARSAN